MIGLIEMYNISRDYYKLYQLIDSGATVVGFCRDKHFLKSNDDYTKKDLCRIGKGDSGFVVSEKPIQGCYIVPDRSYASCPSINEVTINNCTLKEAFIELCREYDVEFIM